MVYLKQILIIILFIISFLFLFALPILIINYRQRIFFSKIATKYHLKYESNKYKITRDFPIAKGYIGKKWIYIQASSLGSYTYNQNYDTHKFASPSILTGIQTNNKKINHFVLIQTKEILADEYVSTDNFYDYFTVEILPKEYQSKIFKNYIQQEIINYSKNKTLLNIMLDNGYLISTANYELTSTKRYKETVSKIELLKTISKQIDDN